MRIKFGVKFSSKCQRSKNLGDSIWHRQVVEMRVAMYYNWVTVVAWGYNHIQKGKLHLCSVNLETVIRLKKVFCYVIETEIEEFLEAFEM